jgi:hypothetical protein
VTRDHRLLSATTRVIDAALRANAADGDGGLRNAMRLLCTDARLLNVHPETLIIQFKRAWRAHAGHSALSRDEATNLLGHVISTCIDEYYRAD